MHKFKAARRSSSHYYHPIILEPMDIRSCDCVSDFSSPPPTFLHHSLAEALAAGEVKTTLELLTAAADMVHSADAGGRTPLHIACEFDRLHLVKALLVMGAELNSRDYWGQTPLELAISMAHTQVVPELIKDFDCSDPEQSAILTTVLHKGCVSGKMSLVKAAVEQGVDYTSKDENGNTPLVLAAMYDHYDMVLGLVDELGCSPNETGNHGMSPLHRACCNGNLSMVLLLIKLGANPQQPDDNHNTPLFLAALHDKTEVVSALLSEFHCDPNDRCMYFMTPLHAACDNRNLSLVHTLLEHGADVNMKNSRYYTALSFAIGTCAYDVVLALLVVTTCKYDSTTRYVGDQTLLHIACSIGHLNLARILIKVYGADPNTPDGDDNTALSVAVEKRELAVVKMLLKEFNCSPNTKGSFGMTPLHVACSRGDLKIALALIKHKAYLETWDNDGRTPLTLAVQNGQVELMAVLIEAFKCDPNRRDGYCPSQLHLASRNNCLHAVAVLLEFGANLNLKDSQSKTALSVAIDSGHYDIAAALLGHEGCEYDPKVCYTNGQTLLHMACTAGHLDLASILIQNYCADLNSRDAYSNTPLMAAIKAGIPKWRNTTDLDLTGSSGKIPPFEITHRLCSSKFQSSKVLRKLKSSPNPRRTSVSRVASERVLAMVELLLQHGPRVDIEDEDHHTPLTLAIDCRNYAVVLVLLSMTDCKYDPNTRYSSGHTLLHIAGATDNVCLARILVRKYNADVNARDDKGDTPLMTAIKGARYGAAMTLLQESKCDPNICDIAEGRSPLHVACAAGNVKLVRAMVQHGNANLDQKDKRKKLLIQTAVKHDRDKVLALLISVCGCDIDFRTTRGLTLLHLAACYQSLKVMKQLVIQFGMSVVVVDSDGNTPLHLSSRFGKQHTVKFLLFDYHASVYVRNSAGETPRDLATPKIQSLIDGYIATHHDSLEAEYKSMQLLAENRYSGSHFIARVFVVGHPGVGKSSLVEALKREKFYHRSKVKEKSVPKHTTGIIPTVYMSSTFGRVQFYDFAGDAEYYSSHAAILEKLLESTVGHNICIIVLDLLEKESEIESKFLYWTTFIGHNSKNLPHSPSFVVVGSHSDLLSRKAAKEKTGKVEALLEGHKDETDHFFLKLDCRNPVSKNINPLRQHIQELARKYKPCNLSFEESVLLGLLEKDFSNVIACTAKKLVSHIRDVELHCLPRSIAQLYSTLELFQAIGILLVLGEKEDCHLVLNISRLTNEVHERLFSKEAFSDEADTVASFNIGLLPHSLLRKVLPPFVNKECLTQLQYCQEITDVEIGHDFSVFPSTESAEKAAEGAEASMCPDNSLLFFPSLCTLDKSHVTWLTPIEGQFSLSWLARRANLHDYFSPRFLHVTLLRIALRFTLRTLPDLYHGSPDHMHFKRRCRMWKTGVHWLTEEGVECEVDIDITKEVLVSVWCETEYIKECLTIFNSIISCIMEAKAEFCHSLPLQFFLLDTIGSPDDSNLFHIQNVESALANGKNKIVSVGGNTWMSTTKLRHIRSTFWESLFAMSEELILESIDEVLSEWDFLGLNLHLSSSVLNVIEANHPSDVKACNVEMVKTWLGSSQKSHPPCWWSLVKALQAIGQDATAAAITEKHGELQYTMCLLCPRSYPCPY